ncbi:MAG: hypothetical protein ACXAEL_10275, partial [Candidatus Hodarchaeales archaeon]
MRLFLFDLDGVIWRGQELIPGAHQVLKTLASHNKLIAYVT